MRNMKWLRLVFLVALVLTALNMSAQAQGGSSVTFDKGKKLKIGWAGDRSLQLIKPSEGVLFGAQIAVDQRNAAGGIQGFEVEVVPQDDQCSGDQSPTVANKFASDPEILGVVGHVCSGATIPASDIYEKARIVLVSASSTAYAVTNRGLTIVNRVAFVDDTQALANATYLFKELGLKKLAVLDDGQSYGKGLAVAMEREFKALGGEVVLTESIDKDAKDYRPVLTKLLATPPDGLFFGGYYGPAALLAQQMKEVGLTNAKFVSADGAYTSDFLVLAGKDAEGAYASSVVTNPDAEKIKAFTAEFETKFNVKYSDYDPYQPHGFDAANMIMDAIAKVAKLDGDKLVVDREALIKAVRETKDFVGLTGTLTCDVRGDCGAGEVALYVVKDGKWEQVKVYNPVDLVAPTK